MSSTTASTAMPSATGRANFDDCENVSELCPVGATILGYYPNLGANIFFTVGFGICLIAALFIGIRKRTWTYVVAIGIGLLMETLGYIGRVLMNDNPWNQSAFELQICCIILAPTFVCISIYLTLKHISLHLNPSLSRISPVWYPRIFLTADISCIVLQGIGGGVAASAKRDDPSTAETGNRIIIAGVVLQVVVLVSFGIMSVDYWIRVRSYFAGNKGPVEENARLLWNMPSFRTFTWAVTGAYFTILIRCIYRIVEMAGGWGSTVMQDQVSFIVLDSCLMLIACYLLTAFHPGIFFPQMCSPTRGSRKNKGADTALESGHQLSSQDGNREWSS